MKAKFQAFSAKPIQKSRNSHSSQNKYRSLIVIIIILFVSTDGLYAQGGLAPLTNSSHTYTITPGNASNTLLWSVSGGAAGDFTINSGANTASTNITWKKAGTYTLQFSETSSTNCITLVQKTVIVTDNTFDVSTPGTLAATCNANSGVPNAPVNAITTVIFAVNMSTGNNAWNPNWEFGFTLTPSAGATLSNVKVSSGTLSGTGPYTVTALPSSSGAGTMTISVDVTGDATVVQTVALAINNAKELQYNTPDSNATNNGATQTINALPATTGFSSN